ncbi:MAG TPA: 3' terminal RNA ribose 2'-O-methyltransferase Hen1 [Actinophytocola sp.]|uniref:3' terminal RNA ribose 2'-O-methyltransferase Hen1 n=1 Tax=Actinophytocola sp. TaxID=1872138 RepID=UPI002DB80844|nr:3' terminal RNA ribose 2'-O-methyltransferase Hen1 [Actinophytocola sp.]HEU5472030.1 3' terminal RNA ribose 2'-O-methyltransferase Hen1 [Actinophytocola sp.]
MLLTLTTTIEPATDLGHLLHKHPDRLQSFSVVAGTAHVFYPKADARECTAALLLDIDPVTLVRGRAGRATTGFTLGQYVNDRPYAASSMLAVALGTVFRTAMNGRCDARPELAGTPIPLRVRIPALPCRGGDGLAERLFAPLGWRVTGTAVPLDPAFPDWGESNYTDLTLTGELRLADALRHLYVLLPVLDNAKHYWVAADEIDKLLRSGDGWLAAHPERGLITSRYLAHRRGYIRSALDRLAEAEEVEPERVDNALAEPVVTELPAAPEPLAVTRRRAVLAALHAVGARRVLDLGCGSGQLLTELVRDRTFTEILGVDVSSRALEQAAARLHLDRASDRVRQRIGLRQSALTYADPTLAGYDAAVLMEVIEHVDEPRLPALERAVFGVARPGSVIVTTPNVEHNVRFETLEQGRLRHPDHRFEWSRAQFRAWADLVCANHGYRVRHEPVGRDDPEVGPPTQLAVFDRTEVS